MILAKQVKPAQQVIQALLEQQVIQAQPAQPAQLDPRDKSDYKGRKETQAKPEQPDKQALQVLQGKWVPPALLDLPAQLATPEQQVLEA